MTRVVIAGGGIAGLSIAWALRKRDPGADLVVLERAARTGGNIRSERAEGYLCEWGPDGFLDNAPDTLRLVRELGLDARLQPSSETARRRFIVRKGRLHEVPDGPLALLRTPLLSARAKARIAWEPFARRRPPGDESIHDFAARRLGAEAAAIFADSMASGIFAGDVRALSLRACFPRLWRLEQDHGSLVRALLATARRRHTGSARGAMAGRLTSFEGGMADLTSALTQGLGPIVRTSAPVRQVRQGDRCGPTISATGPHGYTVVTDTGVTHADAVVLAGPASESAALVREFDPALAGLLEGIETAPVAVVCLGYSAAALASHGPLEGFGFLVPRSENMRILGTLWETSIYPNRAPAGKALLRVMVGGACDPEAVTLGDDRLLQLVRRDLGTTMGVAIAPEFVRIIRHRRGIPQYVTGHLARMEQIEGLLQTRHGLYLAGSSHRGVSINSCIAEADRIASLVLQGARMGPHEAVPV